MKKNFVYVIMGLVLVLICALIVFTIASKQNMKKESFNIKIGDKLEFEKYNTTLEIKKISSIINDKNLNGQIEVIIKAIYDDNSNYYTLKSKTNNKVRLKNSNNYVILSYEEGKIIIDMKDRHEM